MILKQKAFQKLIQMMKLKENQEKKSATSVYRTRMHNKNSVCMERNSPMPKPLGHRAIDITERYNLCSTSEPDKLVASKQQRPYIICVICATHSLPFCVIVFRMSSITYIST